VPTAVQQENLSGLTEKDPKWKLVERIVVAPGFAKSARLSSLLLYIVRQSIEGKDEDLNEQVIGEQVFGRPIGYDPRDDNIVRAHASRLRQRLEAYFQEDGRDELLRITIPRGSYAPIFERNVLKPLSLESPSTSSAEHAAEKVLIPASSAGVKWPEFLKVRWMYFAGGLLCLLLITLGTSRLVRVGWIQMMTQKKCPTQRLWSAIFNVNRDTLIVPADSGLIILKSFTQRPISIAEYASGRYLSNIDCEKPCDSHQLQMLAEHRYTSLADLKFAVTLTHMPEALPNRTEIRYARDLQLDDLKQSNLILIGSLEADPWLELFQHQMNFILHDDRLAGPLRVENRKPLPGERASYVYDAQDPAQNGYALVAFLPNLGGTGNVLVVQGFTLAGTQAAAEFATNDHDFDALFDSVLRKRHELPHFEVLLRTMDVNGIGSHPSIVAYRVY
jgi:hypothetical protein